MQTARKSTNPAVKKAKTDQLEVKVVTERVSSSVVKDEPESQNQLLMFKKIADNFKNLLIGLTSTYPETAKLSEEITNFNENDLCSLRLNDLMESYREAAKRDKKRKAKNERERVKNILKATVVSLDICFFIFSLNYLK
jgi:hypothetical protein